MKSETCDTEVTSSLQSSLWALYTHQFPPVFQISKFSFPGSRFTFSNNPVKIKKATLNLKFNQLLIFFHLSISKGGPLHHQKPNTKHHKTFFLNQKKQTKENTINQATVMPLFLHSSLAPLYRKLLLFFSYP